MNKAYVDSLQQGVRTLAFNLDTYWCLAHHPELSEEERQRDESGYFGFVSALVALGGDYQRDKKGHHRVFLAGLSSRSTDEYEEG